MSYHYQKETKTITEVRTGIDVFHKEPNTVDTLNCKVCDSICDVKRNAFGPTGHLSAMSGNHVLHDRFICPNVGKSWHNLAYKLKREANNTFSESLRKLITQDLNDVLNQGGLS